MSAQPPAGEPDEPPGGEILPPEDVPPVSAEDLVEGDVPAEPVAEERRYPSTLGGAFYLFFLAVVMAGLVVVVLSDWRLGIRIMSGALLGAAAARLMLPSRDAGMLAVRNRGIDVMVLVGLGVAMIWLAGSIPDQPGP